MSEYRNKPKIKKGVFPVFNGEVNLYFYNLKWMKENKLDNDHLTVGLFNLFHFTY